MQNTSSGTGIEIERFGWVSFIKLVKVTKFRLHWLLDILVNDKRIIFLSEKIRKVNVQTK
jgi:hypothetical protein